MASPLVELGGLGMRFDLVLVGESREATRRLVEEQW